MLTPEADAVDFIYGILNAEMGAGPPPGALRALGVKKLIKDEPGSPYDSWIGVLFGGGSENDTSGLATVDVLVDIWSQEVMIGKDNNHLVRFKERIQLCRQLIRAGSGDLNREFIIGPMEYPMEPTEEIKDGVKKYFFNATITAPVYVGGGS